MEKNRVRIAITMGDPAGIGPEIIIKALNYIEVYKRSIPVVIGDYEALMDAIRICRLPLELNEIQDAKAGRGEFGKIDFIDKKYLKE